jgi:anthranilate/para-aminobenzoate synthase component I
MICEIDFPDIHDSAAGSRWRSRFTHPHRVLVAHTLDQVAQVIEQAEKAARDEHWVVGFVAYEAAPAFDSALQVNSQKNTGSGTLPLAVFAIYGYDEALTGTEFKDESFACGPWAMSGSQDAVCADIEVIRAAIAEGDYYQVNLTTRLDAAFSGSAEALFAALRQAQPDGYSAYIDGGDWQVASVSPELFFDWTPDRTLTTRPMKGTATRDVSAAS